MPVIERPVEARAITRGKHHFFGYYDKHAWDATQRYHAALEVDFADRSPEPDDAVTVGVSDLEDGGRFIPIDTTTAWCWQQACMFQWLGSAPDREVVYNIRVGDAYRSRVCDVHSRAVRDLPRPVYCLTPDGSLAGTLNFSRVHWCRPGYGYNGVPDPNRENPRPDNDGVWVMDMATGDARLLVSIADLAARNPDPSAEGADHYVNHLLWNRDGSRLEFLHRWIDREQRRHTRMYTIGPDGSGLHLMPGQDMVSHFDWLGTDRVLAWGRREQEGDHFYLYHDQSDQYEIIAPDVMTRDGHCSFGPDRRFVLNDTYPDRDVVPMRRGLYLYRREDNLRINLGTFLIDQRYPSGELRCDLHPRWSRDGRYASFDSTHEGTRQVYVVDLQDVCAALGKDAS